VRPSKYWKSRISIAVAPRPDRTLRILLSAFPGRTRKHQVLVFAFAFFAFTSFVLFLFSFAPRVSLVILSVAKYRFLSSCSSSDEFLFLFRVPHPRSFEGGFFASRASPRRRRGREPANAVVILGEAKYGFPPLRTLSDESLFLWLGCPTLSFLRVGPLLGVLLMPGTPGAKKRGRHSEGRDFRPEESLFLRSGLVLFVLKVNFVGENAAAVTQFEDNENICTRMQLFCQVIERVEQSRPRQRHACFHFSECAHDLLASGYPC
jgi:hypothetical protein